MKKTTAEWVEKAEADFQFAVRRVRGARLFLYEYLSALPLPHGGASTLHLEGWAMLSALVEDFSRSAGLHIVTLVNTRLKRKLGHTCVHLRDSDEERTFKRLAAEADFTLVIAPEFNNLLLQRCQWVLEAGGRLLGSTPDAVALAADKLALAGYLRQRSIATPPTIRLAGLVAPTALPTVCKPRHGAGSQATFLVRDSHDLVSAQKHAVEELPGEELILQPFVPGLSASVAFLIGSENIVPLLPAAQALSNDGRFRYQGGQLPLPPELGDRAIRLARRALQALPGLRGYIGVDLILGESADGSEDFVIEINPRLTTSYIGLRRLARGNLAEAMLGMVTGAAIPELDWHPGPIRFQSDGWVQALGKVK
jgi:predicted ATP-grasp superfamily ATP-dependent carboligase